MIAKLNKDIEGLKKIGEIVAICRNEIVNAISSGISTKELDDIGKFYLEKYGAHSAPIKDYNFPGFTCISVNEEVAHGIPSNRMIEEGDIVNIDVSAELNGYYADTGISVIVGDNQEKKLVCECAKEALYNAIKVAKAGIPIYELGRSIEDTAHKYGYNVVKNLTGHGIGKSLHESPEYVLNYFDKHEDLLLRDGMVLAIEAFVSTKTQFVFKKSDDWTLVALDGSIVAQYEHTIIVTDDEAIITTRID